MPDSVDLSGGDGWRRSREWGLAEVWKVYKMFKQQHLAFFDNGLLGFWIWRNIAE